MEGAGGTTRPGDVLKRSTFRKYFAGGLAVAGVFWFLTSVRPFSSKLEPVTSKAKDLSRGGTKVPTVPYEKDTNSHSHPEGPTYKTGPRPSPHDGVAAGHSEGAKPRF
ncbi:hypothetical protein R1sor_027082 [Riccia sorocarpa]|uniref:Uncharacterized protein n=1 Tax=Riccia sorocarpa TaxID=122646 RepID=A0ABD3GIZ1_9MARC